MRRSGTGALLVFPAWEKYKFLVHGFSSRLGGVSLTPYASLNLGFHTGDDPANVRRNREILTGQLGFGLADLVAGQQVHGDKVAVIGPDDRGKGGEDMASAIPATDALVTATPGIPLIAFFADCVPVLLVDPDTPAVGVAHAGWKGTVSKIVCRALETMHQTFGTKPGNCLAGIGPSVGSCCYEVGEEVADEVRRVFPRGGRLLLRSGKPRLCLDLWEANRIALLESGVLPENILIGGFCTCCRPDLFFSYRAEQGQTGRLGALIMLK